MNATLCCNAQKKAKRRVLPASTILKKNYYTRHSEYLYNRCQTFEQKAFNFYSGPSESQGKPGGPESYANSNSYVANCPPNATLGENEPINGSSGGCKVVIYKPNNYQYAQQGAVSSSARMLRLNVNTIDKNRADIKNPLNNILYKNKTPSCDPSLYRKSGDAYQCVRL